MSFATPRLVFDNVAASLLLHPDGYVLVRYHAGTLEVADLAPLLTELGRLLLEHSWHKLLVDTRLLMELTPEVLDWTRLYWKSGRIARPRQLWQATLLPTDVFARLGVAELQLESHDGYELRTFGSEESAHTHLLSLPAIPQPA